MKLVKGWELPSIASAFIRHLHGTPSKKLIVLVLASQAIFRLVVRMGPKKKPQRKSVQAQGHESLPPGGEDSSWAKWSGETANACDSRLGRESVRGQLIRRKKERRFKKEQESSASLYQEGVTAERSTRH